MPASSRLPLTVLLLLAAIALLLSLSCPVAATTGNDYSGGRAAIIHGRGTRVVAAAAVGGAAPNSSWQRRRLGEGVAPEFSSLQGAGQGYISYDTLNNNRQACGGGCAARGASYTRPCLYTNQCRQ